MSAITNPFKGYDMDSSINVDISTANLLDCHTILSKYNVDYNIIFGTLLGIYRDGSLIPYDSDVDIGINSQSIDNLINALPSLINIGFEVIRYKPQDGILSIIRNGDYVDLYIFITDSTSICRCGPYPINTADFKSDSTIKFKNVLLPTISNPESFFRLYYGRDWKTPISGLHGTIANRNRI